MAFIHEASYQQSSGWMMQLELSVLRVEHVGRPACTAQDPVLDQEERKPTGTLSGASSASPPQIYPLERSSIFLAGQG